jgi:uncharacterized protein (DUF1810 family)
MSANDPFDLQRFVDAQEKDVGAVTEELRQGRKRSHWMWYVFPQVHGLGRSLMAQRYAIRSLDEAKAYLEHPVLGKRLKDWTQLVLDVEGKSAREIFGSPDDLKFRSSMTLFSRVDETDPIFAHALDKYYGGKPDDKTLRILGVS